MNNIYLGMYMYVYKGRIRTSSIFHLKILWQTERGQKVLITQENHIVAGCYWIGFLLLAT